MPKRVAAHFAGFDLGNPCDAEALSHGLALRREAAKCGMRIVDLLELPDVKRAVDEQLQPKRSESDDLRIAIELAESLRLELTERTRDVRNLVDQLIEQQKVTAEARDALADIKLHGAGTSAGTGIRSHCFGAQSWVLEAAALITAMVLMFLGLIHDFF